MQIDSSNLLNFKNTNSSRVFFIEPTTGGSIRSSENARIGDCGRQPPIHP